MKGILLIIAGVCIAMAVGGGGTAYWIIAVSDVIMYIIFDTLERK